MGELRHPVGESGGVPLQHEQVDLSERPLDPCWVEAFTLRAQDLLSRRRLGPLLWLEQILVELIPGASADADNPFAQFLDSGRQTVTHL